VLFGVGVDKKPLAQNFPNQNPENQTNKQKKSEV